MQKTVQKLKASSLTLSASRLNRSDVARLLLNSDGESVSFFAVVAFLLSLQGAFFVAVVAGAFFFAVVPRVALLFLLLSPGDDSKKNATSTKKHVYRWERCGGAFFCCRWEPGYTHSLASWVRATRTKTRTTKINDSKKKRNTGSQQ